MRKIAKFMRLNEMRIDVREVERGERSTGPLKQEALVRRIVDGQDTLATDALRPGKNFYHVTIRVHAEDLQTTIRAMPGLALHFNPVGL